MMFVVFLRSIRPIRRFIHVDEENLAPVRTANSRSQQQSATLSSYMTDDIRRMSLDYPELINFMSNLARDDDHGVNRMSRLYKAKETQNDFRWEISFLYVGEYKYCERIKRHHNNNNILYVFREKKHVKSHRVMYCFFFFA